MKYLFDHRDVCQANLAILHFGPESLDAEKLLQYQRKQMQVFVISVIQRDQR